MAITLQKNKQTHALEFTVIEKMMFSVMIVVVLIL